MNPRKSQIIEAMLKGIKRAEKKSEALKYIRRNQALKRGVQNASKKS